ncbi:MAG: transglutaminase domain-containing protein [Tenuifilaceae bacterium]|jgi:hypothetical protein|nr:transglutaminase domain-containing protein [Tenuifilaceae bacterium]
MIAFVNIMVTGIIASFLILSTPPIKTSSATPLIYENTLLFTDFEGESLKQRFKELDDYALNVPSTYSSNMELLVDYLIKPTYSDIEKARVIFRWITNNVTYDDRGYNTGKYSDVSAEGVFKYRIAVCEGFSELFKVMGTLAGLEIEKVSGYSKGYSYTPGSKFSDTNHAWNLIKIDGAWKLFDITWAEGNGVTENGKLKSIKKYDEFWFNTDPYNFIFSHLPEDPKWQLIERPISKQSFEKLPYVQSTFFELGFNGKVIFDQIANGLFSGFPETYSIPFSLKVISLPHSKKLKAGEILHLEIESTEILEMAVINNGNWTYFEQLGNVFTLDFTPERGSLSISAKSNPEKVSFDRIIDYDVK